MIQAVALACFLLMAPVRDCDPRAQGYVAAAHQLPASHLAMVSEIYITDGDHGRTNGGTVVGIPAKPARRVLFHETGHVVAKSLGLYKGYEEAFWSNGRAIGRTTQYGHSSPREDFADCYAAVIIRNKKPCGSGRYTWILNHAFGGH